MSMKSTISLTITYVYHLGFGDSESRLIVAKVARDVLLSFLLVPGYAVAATQS